MYVKYMQEILEAKETTRRKLTFTFSYLFTVFFRFQFENYDLPLEDTFYQCHEGMYICKCFRSYLPGWLFDYLLTVRQEESQPEDMAAAYGMSPPSIVLGQRLTYCIASICNHSSWSGASLSLHPDYPPDYQLAEPSK